MPAQVTIRAAMLEKMFNAASYLRCGTDASPPHSRRFALKMILGETLRGMSPQAKFSHLRGLATVIFQSMQLRSP